MYKFISIFLMSIYVVPLTYFSYINSSFPGALVVLATLSFWLFSVWLYPSYLSYDYRGYCIPKAKVVLLVACFYFLVRYDLIFEIVQRLISGDYIAWALGRAVDRYEGGGDYGIRHKIGTIFFITYAFLIGAFGFRRHALFFIILFLGMSFVESSALARAGVILALVAYTVEAVVRYNAQLARLPLKWYAIIGFSGVVLLAFIFLFSAYYRVSNSDNIAEILINKAGIYTIAMYDALMIWLSTPWDYTYGYATFTALYKFAGIDAPQGFYLPVDTRFGSTNIFTLIRGLLSDFGFLGLFIFFLGTGVLVKYAATRKMGVLHYFLLRLMLYLLLFVLISPYSFATVFVAFLFSYFLLVFFNGKEDIYSS